MASPNSSAVGFLRPAPGSTGTINAVDNGLLKAFTVERGEKDSRRLTAFVPCGNTLMLRDLVGTTEFANARLVKLVCDKETYRRGRDCGNRPLESLIISAGS